MTDTLEAVKKKEQDQLKILADQMARLGLDFGESDIFANQRKSKINQSETSLKNLINLQKEKEKEKEDEEKKERSLSSQQRLSTEEKKNDFEPLIANQLRRSSNLRSKSKTSNEISLDNSNNETTTNIRTKNDLFDDDDSIAKGTEILEIRPELDNFMLTDSDTETDQDTTIMSGIKVSRHNKKLSLYEREMKHLKYKEKLLEAKRMKILQKRQDMMQDAPEMNEMSEYLVDTRGGYIPLYKRAGEIHSQHLAQIALNMERKKMQADKMAKEQETEIENQKKRRKKYNKEDWDEFLRKQMKWKNDVMYKRKAGELIKENNKHQYPFNPEINAKSKNIIRKMQKDTDVSSADPWERLYKDNEEHKERQKIREIDALPSFKPTINSNKKLRRKKNKLDSKDFTGDYSLLIGRREKNNTVGSEREIVTRNLKVKMKEPLVKMSKKKGLKKSQTFIPNDDELKNSFEMNWDDVPINIVEQSEILPTEPKIDDDDSTVDKDKEDYTAAMYKVRLEKEKRAKHPKMNRNQKIITVNAVIQQDETSSSRQTKSQGGTITTVLGMPEMFAKQTKGEDDLYSNMLIGNGTTGNTQGATDICTNPNKTDADSLYKLNIANSTANVIREDTVIATKKYGSFFQK